MKQLTITAQDVTADLTIRHATAGDSLRREMLVGNAFENPQPDRAEQTLAVVFYPRCVSCAEGTIHWPGHTRDVVDPETQEVSTQPAEMLNARELTPAEFINLPFEIFDAWWNAVCEETPGWALRKPVTPAQQENPPKNS